MLSTRFIKANDEVCDFGHPVPAPYFRKSLQIDSVPKTATITICGLGFYEFHVNGKNITKGPLAPYISNPDDLCYYDAYDVAAELRQGENVIGVLLGNGFRNAFGGFVWDFDQAKSRGPVILALSFDAETGKEGAPLHFEADESFRTHDSPVVFNDSRMGCRYDARLEIPGWDLPGFDDSAWAPARRAEAPRGDAKLCSADPIVVSARLSPVHIDSFAELPFAYQSKSVTAPPRKGCTRKDVYVYDFGENNAGVTELRINGTPGQTITIRHGEWLQNGKFSVETTIFDRAEWLQRYLDHAQTDVFICKGGEEVFTPRFKYDGFRYAYVEGLRPDQATPEALTFVVLNSNLKARAGFVCSDERLNRLFAMTRRADLSNFHYFPTDCPHREQNGWTGDASISAEHMLLNLTADASLREWLANIRKAQNDSGALPGIVPTGGWGYKWGCGPIWDNVSVEIPYQLLRFGGDVGVVRENAATMLRYLSYALTKRDKRGLVAYGLGDWVDPFQNENGGRPFAPLDFVDSTMIFDYAKKAAFLFRQAGLPHEAAFASGMARDFRRALRKHGIDKKTCTAACACQTSQALALCHGLFEESELSTARRRLVELIHDSGDINRCGMIGLRYIYHALADMGETTLAHRLIVNESRSCYGAWLKEDSTTLWEDFPPEGSVGDSHNHHFLGDIASWMIQDVAGLRPNPSATDPDEFVFAPNFPEDLDHAEAWFDAACGRVSIAWKRTKAGISLSLALPEGLHGTLRLSNGFTADGLPSIPITGSRNAMRLALRKRPV